MNQKSSKPNLSSYKAIPQELEVVGKKIVEAAFTVHRNLGPGLSEKVYEVCFCHELMKRGLTYQRHVHVPINYDGITFEHGLKIDLLVEGQVICKVKAAEFVNPVLEAQVVSHLKITGNRMGFVINFYVVNMNQGIRRVMI